MDGQDKKIKVMIMRPKDFDEDINNQEEKIRLLQAYIKHYAHLNIENK